MYCICKKSLHAIASLHTYSAYVEPAYKPTYSEPVYKPTYSEPVYKPTYSEPANKPT